MYKSQHPRTLFPYIQKEYARNRKRVGRHAAQVFGVPTGTGNGTNAGLEG